MTFQKAKAFQSLTALNFSSIYLIAHIWHPFPGPSLPGSQPRHLRKMLAWGFLIFPGPLSLPFFGFKMSTNWQNRIISAWHRTWQPDNTSKARSTSTLTHIQSACKVPRWKFVSPAVLWHFYCLIIPIYGNLHHYGSVANETNCHKMLGKS